MSLGVSELDQMCDDYASWHSCFEIYDNPLCIGRLTTLVLVTLYLTLNPRCFLYLGLSYLCTSPIELKILNSKIRRIVPSHDYLRKKKYLYVWKLFSFLLKWDTRKKGFLSEFKTCLLHSHQQWKIKKRCYYWRKRKMSTLCKS